MNFAGVSINDDTSFEIERALETIPRKLDKPKGERQPRDHMSLRLALANEKTNHLLGEALQFELSY